MSAFDKAVKRLDGLVNYEHSLDQPYTAENYDLERFRRFLESLGSPQKKFPALHVAGTKGKGSVCLIAEAVLCEHELKAGTYLSPHLESYRERIRIDGNEISEEDFAAAFEKIEPILEEAKKNPGGAPTHFEVLTALAFIAFADAGVDIAILEVGLGGRLDATNVCNPIVSVITPIDLEHTAILGDSIGKIAEEKAGIIREKVPVFTSAKGAALETIKSICSEKNTWCAVPGIHFSASNIRKATAMLPGLLTDILLEVGIIGNLYLPLAGHHQAENAAVALAASQRALVELGKQFNPSAAEKGLTKVRIPGRVEIISSRPLVVLDAAHTPDSASALKKALEFHFPERKYVFVVALLRDKNSKEIISRLAPAAERFIATATPHPRAMPVEETAAAARLTDIPSVAEPEAETALERALKAAGEEGSVVITGSFYLAGMARKFIKELDKRTI
ncbi:MAG: bifunctional folylpolyglutamate synthase/dihydrofolate synthase [Planctomycetota bacterium]|jgi:dihydrofolate synthase/folylpolyglutamate synthase